MGRVNVYFYVFILFFVMESVDINSSLDHVSFCLFFFGCMV